MANRNNVGQATELDTTPTPVTTEVIADTFASEFEVLDTLAAPKEFVLEETPIDVALTASHIASIPHPVAGDPSLGHFVKEYEVRIAIPEALKFNAEAAVKYGNNATKVPFGVHALVMQRVNHTVGMITQPEARSDYHMLFLGKTKNGKYAPGIRAMVNLANVTNSKGDIIGRNININSTWGAPDRNAINAFAKNQIKETLRSALAGETKYQIIGTDKTLAAIIAEFEAGKNPTTATLSLPGLESTGEDLFASEE